MNVLFYSADPNHVTWPDELHRVLPAGTQVRVWQPGAPRADYAVVWKPPQQLLDEQTGLKALFNFGAGVDALKPLRFAPGVPVIRLEDVGMGVQMVEYVLHAITTFFRGLDVYTDEMRRGIWHMRPLPERAEYPVGVMGLGVLGAQVAQAATQWGYPVNGWSRSPKDMGGVRCFHGPAGFHDFLAATRVLVCLLPLTEATRGVMNRDSLSRLQRGGFVINVARGAHLVEDDLIPLIDSGHLAGAALDVFCTEPLPADHPYIQHPKITCTPHISARTLRDEAFAQIAQKIARLQRGERVSGVIDNNTGY